MGIRDRLRALRQAGRERQTEREAAKAEDEAHRLHLEQESAAQQEVARAVAEATERRLVLGDDLYDMNVSTPAEAKIAIKLARLRKKEIQAEKRELAAELADVREEWRDRQAGRVSTIGLGRGTGGRIMRGAVQAKRRSEKMSHAEVVNEFSNRKQEYDRQLIMLDRLIAEMERKALA